MSFQAHTVYYIFREDCYKGGPILTQECISFSISKTLGYLIILGSLIVKFPQILKINANKSVEGLSKFLFYQEVTPNPLKPLFRRSFTW